MGTNLWISCLQLFNEKFVSLQRPVLPYTEGVTILEDWNVLTCHAFIILQTSKPPTRRLFDHKLKALFINRVHEMRFNEGRFMVFIPKPDTLPQHFSFCLEWTPGPVKWPTDERYFEECHTSEIELAAGLRLSGKKYLDTKKRIFLLRALLGASALPMTKIDVQRACRVDRKTAGSLYTAFKHVGWFRRELFKQFVVYARNSKPGL